ncbi:hypothetical protein [Amycolatopsis sp. NPDC098790]|uniref:hypothetical protein n=1 Tax=Amycolatopsis sp. NPDC098790 TaxID=3363939 RepID=UPI00380B339F
MRPDKPDHQAVGKRIDAVPTAAIAIMPSQFDQQWFNRLTLAHNYELPERWRLLRYYDGRQRVSYMHPELQATLDERVRQVVINWPRLVVDALEKRIDLQGSRLGRQPANDTELDHVAQHNDLDAGYHGGPAVRSTVRRHRRRHVHHRRPTGRAAAGADIHPHRDHRLRAHRHPNPAHRRYTGGRLRARGEASGVCLCIILVGRPYRYSQGFRRHPRCDCTMTPVTREHWRETNLDTTRARYSTL